MKSTRAVSLRKSPAPLTEAPMILVSGVVLRSRAVTCPSRSLRESARVIRLFSPEAKRSTVKPVSGRDRLSARVTVTSE